MKEVFFHQRSRLGDKFFALEGDQLHVSGRRGFKTFQCTFDLRDVALHSERIRGRTLGLVAIPLLLASGVALGVRLCVNQTSLPHEIIVVPGLIVIGTLLWQAIRGINPLEIIQFHSKQGGVLFDIIKEKRQAEQCERFISELSLRIEKRYEPAR